MFFNIKLLVQGSGFANQVVTVKFSQTLVFISSLSHEIVLSALRTCTYVYCVTGLVYAIKMCNI